MFSMFGGLSLLWRVVLYGGAIVAVAGSLYTGYRVWRHSIWVEGRDAAIHAVEKQNSIAADAAKKVELTTDACFDQGGSWDVTTGSCSK